MTATVSAISCSFAGSMVTELTIPLSVSTVLLVYADPTGFRTGAHDSLVGVDGLVGVRRSHGLQDGLVHGAGPRMRPSGRGQRVDHQVDLADVPPDRLQRLRLDFVRECVAVDVLRVESLCARRLRESY